MAIQSVQKPSRTWLGMCAALVLAVLVGAFVWWLFRAPTNSGELDVGNVPASARMRSQIQSDGKGDWNVWSSPASLYISGSQQFNLNVRDKGVSDEMRNLVIMAIRVGHDHHAAQAINATKDQVAKVRDLQFPHTVLSADDLATLKKLWNDYQGASDTNKLTAKIALLDGVHNIGESSIPATKKLWADDAALIKSTFSADQIKKLQQYQRNAQRPNQAAALPTSRPAKAKIN